MRKISKIRNENGMVIIEAAIIFPFIFLVLFFMIFVGNIYYQKCRIEAIVAEFAYKGAAYCADPLLPDIEEGNDPYLEHLDVKPYRFIIGNMDFAMEHINNQLRERMDKLDSGLLFGMKPTHINAKAEFKHDFISSSFRIEAHYNIPIPVRSLVTTDHFIIPFSVRLDVPVICVSEFIRNLVINSN